MNCSREPAQKLKLVEPEPSSAKKIVIE